VVGPPAEFCPAAANSIVPSSVPSTVPSLAPASADICVCQPDQITFVLDFTLNCDDRTILTGNPGIKDAACLIFPDGVDPIPVSLESVLIYETDLDFNLINMVNYTESFSSGDMITYKNSGGLIPTGITVALKGINKDGEKVTNSFAILYTNQCDVYPVLVDGDQIGWTKLVCTTEENRESVVHVDICYFYNVAQFFFFFSKCLSHHRLSFVHSPHWKHSRLPHLLSHRVCHQGRQLCLLFHQMYHHSHQ
jgi:hypothetical protein